MIVWAEHNIELLHSMCGKPMGFYFHDGHARFKPWEYSFVYEWLKTFSASLNLDRKVRVMDFGAGKSPFGQFLVERGFEVWGIDNNSMSCGWTFESPDVTYWHGSIMDFEDTKFDAIVSCSVLEHLHSDDARIMITKKLRDLLNPHGKMIHVIDYNYPEREIPEGRRTDFYKLAQALEFEVPDLTLCPGAPGFDFENIRHKLNLVCVDKYSALINKKGDHLRKPCECDCRYCRKCRSRYDETRIVIGDG
jgi:hypothetical protein